ncbi:MAG TPA: flagellar hook-associated protein FlgK [Candidatus Desulfofervidus auxilii]|uniref:Flagellar hook-associated protein 1 n=1 Tax=Desulfofervidus auxilii TaxID=1621989 RepID=A0A7V0I9V2_DESA2|nr:flagellar hook-associated protein FlgK [Candidatus Desulfofervidus auxilii]
MHGIYGLIDIGISAIRAAQMALMVTGDNIANAENSKFCRRRVIFQEKPPLLSLPILIGRGSEVTNVKRAYSPFLAKQWQQELAGLGYHEVRKEALGRLETIFNEAEGEGLNRDLTAFWNAWEEVSSDPASIVNRYNLINTAKTLAANFQRKSNDLKELREDMNTEVKNVVEQINTIANQIAYLNKKIKSIEIKGVDANNFRDERDELVRELSKLADVTAFEDNGKVTVLVGGVAVVQEESAYTLSVETNSEGFYQVVWYGEGGLKVDITSRLEGGELGSFLEMRDTIIPQYQNDLDRLAYNLVTEINTQHQLGYGLDDSTGNNFFEPLTGIDDAASLIQLDSTIETFPEKIAASSAAGQQGNNENALAIIALKETAITGLSDVTFNDFYLSLVGEVGSASQESQNNFEYQQLVLKEIEASVEAVSGVSLDEEAANLVRFQQMYTASARLISIADDMMKTLINLGT